MIAAAAKIGAIAFNTYREAVRARILHGLVGLAIATALYSVAIGEFALRNASRVVADLGAASISLYAVFVAIVIGATSLYREVEQKTIFPILARPIGRAAYLIGKFCGTVLTLATFVALDASVVLFILAHHGGRGIPLVFGMVGLLLGSAIAVAWKLPRIRTYVPLAWSFPALLLAWVLASGAPDDRRLLLSSSVLTLLEVMVVTAVATVFSAFSSPFLTAVLTLGLFIVGREADTLAKLPERVFGAALHSFGAALSAVVPNLQVYVPARPLLTGEVAGVSLGAYLALAAFHALAWSIGLLVAAHWIFRRRDLV